MILEALIDGDTLASILAWAPKKNDKFQKVSFHQFMRKSNRHVDVYTNEASKIKEEDNNIDD